MSSAVPICDQFRSGPTKIVCNGACEPPNGSLPQRRLDNGGNEPRGSRLHLGDLRHQPRSSPGSLIAGCAVVAGILLPCVVGPRHMLRMLVCPIVPIVRTQTARRRPPEFSSALSQAQRHTPILAEQKPPLRVGRPCERQALAHDAKVAVLLPVCEAKPYTALERLPLGALCPYLSFLLARLGGFATDCLRGNLPFDRRFRGALAPVSLRPPKGPSLVGGLTPNPIVSSRLPWRLYRELLSRKPSVLTGGPAPRIALQKPWSDGRRADHHS